LQPQRWLAHLALRLVELATEPFRLRDEGWHNSLHVTLARAEEVISNQKVLHHGS
jgi:hypothetical protein